MLPLNNFKWVKGVFEFDESFVKSYDFESDEGCFLEVVVQYTKKLHDLHDDLEKWKSKKSESLLSMYTIESNMTFTWKI